MITSDTLAFIQIFVWVVAGLALLSMPERDDERSWFKVIVFVFAIGQSAAAINWLNETHVQMLAPNWLVMRLISVTAALLVIGWTIHYRRKAK